MTSNVPTTKEDVRTLLTGWLGQTTDVTSTWAPTATAEKAGTHDGQPFCLPDTALLGPLRWAAVVMESAREVHVYFGLRTTTPAQLPDPETVARLAAQLAQSLRRGRVHRDGMKIRFRVVGEMIIHGESSRRYQNAPTMLEAAKDTGVLNEVVPLALGCFGSVLASGGSSSYKRFHSYLIALGFTAVSYVLLVLLRWWSNRRASDWIAQGWPK